jgi:cation transport ATPase
MRGTRPISGVTAKRRTVVREPAAPPSVRQVAELGCQCRACSAHDDHDSWNASVRGETPLQRADRAYGEILQEVRVAQTGVQILFAFLLTLAFTARFRSVTPFQREIYVVTLMLAAAAAALLIAPAAFHRVVYRRRLKQHLARMASMLALAGLVLLLLAMISALLLILDVVTGLGPAMILASGMLAWFFTWWFILPAWSRFRHPAAAAPASRHQ